MKAEELDLRFLATIPSSSSTPGVISTLLGRYIVPGIIGSNDIIVFRAADRRSDETALILQVDYGNPSDRSLHPR